VTTKQNITRTPGTSDDRHEHIKPARVYIKLNITNPPVRRHHALPHNLVTRTNYTSWGVTRTNYTSWGDDPSHLPSKKSSRTKPTWTPVFISPRPSALRPRVSTASSVLRGGFTRVCTASTGLHASRILAIHAVVGSARASLGSLHDKGLSREAQELTFYFRSLPRPSYHHFVDRFYGAPREVCTSRRTSSALLSSRQGTGREAQKLTFYFRSPATPSVSTPLRLCALRSAIRKARETTSND